MKKNVAVTGAAGLLGRYIVNYLHLHNDNVVPVYYNIMPKETVRSLQLDLSNKEDYHFLDKVPISTVVHCAAAIPQTFEGVSAINAAKKNRAIDDNIIEYCAERQIRLIYMSGCSIYGLNHQEIKHEQLVVNPIGAYVQEKHKSEELIINSDLFKPVILRVSSPYGIYQKHQTVLKLFLEKALKDEDIFYYGSGTREQDFVNGWDVAVAVKKIIDNLEIGRVFNIAGGQAFMMKQLAQVIVKTIGSHSKIQPSNQQDGQDGYKVKIDISKAKRLAGWEPQVSLEQGIVSWAEYLRKPS